MILNFRQTLLFFSLLTLFFQLAVGQVIDYKTKITIDKNGKMSTTKTYLIQINSKTKSSFSNIEIPHSPNKKLSFGYAHILDVEGNILRKLKKKELKTRGSHSYMTFYQDDLITEFDLYWNEYPYRIEYSYTIETDRYLYVAGWIPIVFSDLSTFKASLEVDIPADFGIQIDATDDFNFTETENKNRKTLLWQSKLAKMNTSKELYSALVETPYVKIVPKEFNYGVPGKMESWQSYGKWVDELNKDTDQLTLQEETTVKNKTDSLENRNEIIKSLYYYLQDNTKYIDVTIDVGGFKSYPASYVCRNKYGDCKALTTYMQAMLKSVGIESYFTLINSGNKINEIDTNFPSQQFNHVILMVPSEKDTLWLENTSTHNPFNYLGTFTQNRYALVVDGEESQLVKTPALSTDEVLLEKNYNFEIEEDNKTKIDLNITLRGSEFETFRYFLKNNEEESQKEYVESLDNIKDFKLDNWEVRDFNRDSTVLNLQVEGISSAIIRQIGNFQVIKPLRIDIPDFEKPADREHDVAIHYPINKSDRSVYNLELYSEKEIQLPENIEIENQYGFFRAHYSMMDNELIVEEKFTLYANKIPKENYKDFYEFIDSLDKINRKANIIIQ